MMELIPQHTLELPISQMVGVCVSHGMNKGRTSTSMMRVPSRMMPRFTTLKTSAETRILILIPGVTQVTPLPGGSIVTDRYAAVCTPNKISNWPRYIFKLL